MRSAGRVEQDPLDASVKVSPPGPDGPGRLAVDLLGPDLGRQPDRLPDGPSEPGDEASGLIAGELDHVRIEGCDDRVQPGQIGVGGDRHDARAAARLSGAPSEPGQGNRLLEVEGPGRAGDQVQADRVRPAAQGRLHAPARR